MLTALLEYNDFNRSDSIKQLFWEKLPALYILNCCSLFEVELLQLIKCILLQFAPTMPAFCLLLLYSYCANNFAGKINAYLAVFYTVVTLSAELSRSLNINISA